MKEKNSHQDDNIQINKKKSPAWELFWQEHGQELMDEDSPGQRPERINEKQSQENPPDRVNNCANKITQSFVEGGGKTRKEPLEAIHKQEKEAQALDQHSLKNGKPQLNRAYERSAKEDDGNQGNFENKQRRSLSAKGKTILVLVGCAIVLAGAVFGSSYLLEQKLAQEKAIISATIEEKMAELAEANQLALEDINQRMAAIDSQMSDIITILESTDQAILSSGAANREAMAKRIEELDAQLASLRKSLNILMESKGAQ